MVANIFISDVIGEDTTLNNVRSQYAMYKDPSEVVVHINSVGGDVVEGYAIHDYLKSLGKKITTKIEGKCYSIATIIALAGDERLMSENSELMIHNPWMESEAGDSKHFLKVASELHRAENNIAKFYANKVGLELTHVRALMDKETYIDKAKAKDLGFITGEKEQLKAVAQLNNMNVEDNKKAKTLLGEIKKMLGMEIEEKPKAMIETTLDDGTNIVIDSEDGDIVGKTVMISVDGELTPAPSGEHKLSDGRVIVVSDGVISEVKEASIAAEDDDVEKLKEEMAALRAENESLKASKEEAIQAKAKELEALKAESESKFKILGQKLDQLNALVVTEDAPKAQKQNIGHEPAKHKFDNLIKK